MTEDANRPTRDRSVRHARPARLAAFRPGIRCARFSKLSHARIDRAGVSARRKLVVQCADDQRLYVAEWATHVMM